MEQYARNPTVYNRPIYVMQTPPVLELVGAKPLPIYIDSSKLRKIHHDHPEISTNVLRQLPAALRSPMMILKSDTHPDRIVVALSLKDEAGVEILVPFALDKPKEWEQANVITSIYGKGRNGKTRYSWYSEQIERGNLLYAHKEKAVQFLTSAGVQFPMEEQTNSFLTYIVKTDEDLVKFQQQKEEEKVMAQLITPQEEERKKNMMETTEKQEQSEVNHDLSDAYFEEISKSLEYAEPPLTGEEYEELQSGAKELHGAMRNLEEAEHVAGPDQEAWDEYASRHNDIKEKIEQAGDAREDGASEEECKALVTDAKTAMQRSTDFFKERYEALLERQRAYEDQIQALKDQVEEMQKQIAASGALAQGVGMCPYANYVHCMAASVQFMKQMEKMRQEAATQPRPIASALFKATREFASDAYHAVRFAPVKLKDMLVRKVHEKVDNLLFRVAGSFDDRIQSLEKTRNSILSHAHEFKTAAEFYQDAAEEEARQHGEGRVDLMAERRIADKMAVAGFGAYTIEKTILANSSNAEEMKKGIAHDFAKKAEESAKKHQNENKKQDKNVR